MSGGDAWLLSPVRMQNFILEANIDYESGHSGLIFRANKSGSSRSVVIIANGLVKYFSFPGYEDTVTKVYTVEIRPNNTYNLKLVVNGDSLKVYVDGELAMEKTIASPVSGQDYMGAFQYMGTAKMDHFYVSDWNKDETGVTPTPGDPTPAPTEKTTENPVYTVPVLPDSSANDHKIINEILPVIVAGISAIVVVTIIYIVIKKKQKAG